MDFFHTDIPPRSIELAVEVLRSGWVSEGRMVKQFEEALADRLRLSHPVAVNSGTAALHLALAVAGVGPGDEVILPAQTFIATGLAVLMQGATCVFADVDPQTGNLDPRSVTAAITPRSKAVMPVHWGGYPCDMDEINDVASAYGLVVVEDAAHALGATYRGRPVGAISHFTAFSFQAVKHLTTGDGGAVCSLDARDAEAARVRRWFGIDRARSTPSILGEREFDVSALGYKYHMNDLAAAVGLGAVEEVPARLARRQEIAARFREGLAGVPGLRLVPCAGDRTHAYWFFTVLVERREEFIRRLAREGIPATVVHQRIDRYSIFGGMRDDLPGQAAFSERQVALPVHHGLSDDDVEKIVATVRSGW